MKFALSYSTGKDCFLALLRMIAEGNEPVALVTSVDKTIKRSWFHGVPEGILQQVADSLGLPLLMVENDATDYQEQMVKAFAETKALGAEAIVFGDIDIQQNGEWDRTVAEAAGLKAILPLWQQDRRTLVEEFLASGYTAIIKTVAKSAEIPEAYLGQPLNGAFITYLEAHGLDACGENGEYHTLVVAGPLFKEQIRYQTAGIYESEYAKSLIIE